MTTLEKETIVVLSPRDGESPSALLRRIAGEKGQLLLIVCGYERELFPDDKERKSFLDDCKPLAGRLRLATTHKPLISDARARGFRVLDQAKYVSQLLEGQDSLSEALRLFSPQLWRRQLQNRLQSMGLLSLPKLRITTLIGLSIILFWFVVFRLLPSAEVRVWPRIDTISQTVNIFLVGTGAQVALPERVRMMPLVPVTVTVRKSLTFDQISKQFIGKSAVMPLTIVNKSLERYPFKKGTRFVNQAGVVFRLQDFAIVEPGQEVDVEVVADDNDLYGELIGERGNVPEGLKWDVPGLSVEERKLVYGENRKPGRGGTTNYRTVLHEQDLETAKKQLEQELLTAAKQMVEEERQIKNSQTAEQQWEFLNYSELTRVQFSDFTSPTQFLGEQVNSIPVEGVLTYTMFSYDAKAILDMLREELTSHVRDGKHVLADTLSQDRLVVHVIDYSDDLSWIKLTVDLSGSQQYDLDPLTPTGARFAKKVREKIVGLSADDAIRIIKNMPEVENAEVSIWPPWNWVLPNLAAHIGIELQDGT